MYDDMELIMPPHKCHRTSSWVLVECILKLNFIIGEDTVIIHIKCNKYLFSTSNHLTKVQQIPNDPRYVQICIMNKTFTEPRDV